MSELVGRMFVEAVEDQDIDLKRQWFLKVDLRFGQRLAGSWVMLVLVVELRLGLVRVLMLMGKRKCHVKCLNQIDYWFWVGVV